MPSVLQGIVFPMGRSKMKNLIEKLTEVRYLGVKSTKEHRRTHTKEQVVAPNGNSTFAEQLVT